MDNGITDEIFDFYYSEEQKNKIKDFSIGFKRKMVVIDGVEKEFTKFVRHGVEPKFAFDDYVFLGSARLESIVE